MPAIRPLIANAAAITMLAWHAEQAGHREVVGGGAQRKPDDRPAQEDRAVRPGPRC